MAARAPAHSLGAGSSKTSSSKAAASQGPRRIWGCVEGLRDANMTLKTFFTIPLTDRHHAVQRNLRPVLLIVRNDDMVHDVAFDKVLQSPAEMGSIDSEHRRTLADRGGEEENLLVGEIAF